MKSLLLLDFEIMNNWFYENFMILNPGKSYYMREKVIICDLENVLIKMRCLTLITLLQKVAKN